LLLAHLVSAGITDRFRFLTWDLGGEDVEIARQPGGPVAVPEGTRRRTRAQ
jgi:hypothetical protein